MFTYYPEYDLSRVLQEDGIRWKCTLNQTVREDNENNFFIIALLWESNESGNYTVLTIHGRVGEAGRTLILVPTTQDLSKAKDAFEQKFMDITGNMWSLRHDFVKVYRQYDWVNMDEDICGDSPILMNGDYYEAPLGKLSKRQVDAGYNALMEIKNIVELTENQIHVPNPVDYTEPLKSACNKFYTRIPQRFGRNVHPPLIKNMTDVQAKLSLFVYQAGRNCRVEPCAGMTQWFFY